MPVFSVSNNRKRWVIILLGILFFAVVVVEIGILYKDNKLQSAAQLFFNRDITIQTKPSVDDSTDRSYSWAGSPTPPVSPVIASLPVSSINHYSAVTFYKNLNGETAWMDGMFTYVAKASGEGKQNIKPEVVSGVVRNIEGDIFTIAPLPEIEKYYTGPPTISVRTLPTTSFWRITYTPVDKQISKMTDKRKISRTDVEKGDNVGFRDLDVSGGIITSLTVYDY